jgi:putative glutamine amidotransferase
MMRPRIAVLMDENTSAGGTHYEGNKGYWHALTARGAAAYGVPYEAAMVPEVIAGFEGLLTCGGRFAYPDDWYVAVGPSRSPQTARLDVELALVHGFLAAGKPVLGICAGMQLLACSQGSKMVASIADWRPGSPPHDERGRMHGVTIVPGSLLARTTGVTAMQVNTFHREAVAETAPGVVATAWSEDGVIEAIELPAHRFALGVQWHPEHFASLHHPSNGVFEGFVRACGG